LKHLPLLLGLTLTACGYHVGNQVNLLPKDLHTIAIPAWNNATTQYKIAGFMAEAVTREMITRTRYTVVADPSKADATLTGSIANIFSSASTYDPVTNRTTGGQIVVQMQVRLVAKDGKVLFDRPHLEFRDRYEVSVNPGQFLDESQSTLQRISRDAARDIVSAVLENF
jgi:outer membrane lipopolysaccharide assembly protein LptE/RlpB